MLKKIKLTLVRMIARLAPLVSKDEKLVLFGAMSGHYYADNAKYLFEWLIANKDKEEIRPVWITRNYRLFKILKKKRYPVRYAFSIGAIRALFRANIAVFTNNMNDFSLHYSMVPKDLKLLSLRHGKSVKKVRFAREKHKIDTEEAQNRRVEGEQTVYALSTSPFISDIQEACLQIGRKKHVVTGYPRNDALFHKNKRTEKLVKHLGINVNQSKLILYAPSWRHGRNPTIFFPFDDFHSGTLHRFLETGSFQLIIRPHKNDLDDENTQNILRQISKGRTRIKILGHDVVPDVNALLPYIDVLLSDYSGIYHDYLLLDRPMIFIPYDYEEFKEENGFMYDYYDYLPGPAVTSQKGLQEALKKISNKQEEYSKKRAILRDKVHYYQDDKSCERVAKLLIEMVKKE